MSKLFVIAGHGAGDPGAMAFGYKEAEQVRALALKIKQFGGDNVILGDINRNYYADKGINTLNISKDTKIIELHMDSATPSARGGHIIIKEGFEPDEYDKKLADFISSILPGRSQTIVKRNNLANPKRAAARGFNYRLLENGFISNENDLKIFNENIDNIAKGILKCFDINAENIEVKPVEEIKPVEIKKGSEEIPMYIFKNGKTVEDIFADTNLTRKIGSLNKWEECECFGIFNGRPIVRYQVGNTGNFKIGFAKDTRCVKNK